MKNTIYRHTAPYKIEKFTESLEAPDKDYVTVEFLYCGICGGDYSCYLGRRESYPISLGHEWIGVVVATGDGVSSLQEGTLVVTDFNYRCGVCTYCTTGRSHLCIQNNIGLFSNRGFATYANIHYTYLHPVSHLEHLSRGCLIEPLSCVIHAYEKAKFCQDAPVLIYGGGSIGMLFSFYLSRILHHKQVYVAEVNTSRKRNLIQQFHIKEHQPEEAIIYDTVIDCTNSIEGMRLAVDTVQPGGNICIMSHLYGLDTSFLYEFVCQKELHATFPLRNGSSANLNTAMKLIQTFWTSSDDCMIQIFEDVITAFHEKERSPFNKQIIHLNDIILPYGYYKKIFGTVIW